MRITDEQINRAWARLRSSAPGAPPAHVWVSIRGQVVVCDDAVMPSTGAAAVGAFRPDISLADFAAEVQHVGAEMTAELGRPVLRAIKAGCNTHRSISLRTGLQHSAVRYRVAELRDAGLITEGPQTRCHTTGQACLTFQLSTQGEGS
jgi:hypothetical protein